MSIDLNGGQCSKFDRIDAYKMGGIRKYRFDRLVNGINIALNGPGNRESKFITYVRTLNEGDTAIAIEAFKDEFPDIEQILAAPEES